jgi:hypothetical protein
MKGMTSRHAERPVIDGCFDGLSHSPRLVATVSLEVRDVPTGGGRRAATTVRSDFGSDRTDHDTTLRMSIRLEIPLGRDTKEYFGREQRTDSGFRVANETGAAFVGGIWTSAAPKELDFAQGIGTPTVIHR